MNLEADQNPDNLEDREEQGLREDEGMLDDSQKLDQEQGGKDSSPPYEPKAKIHVQPENQHDVVELEFKRYIHSCLCPLGNLNFVQYLILCAMYILNAILLTVQ